MGPAWPDVQANEISHWTHEGKVLAQGLVHEACSSALSHHCCFKLKTSQKSFHTPPPHKMMVKTAQGISWQHRILNQEKVGGHKFHLKRQRCHHIWKIFRGKPRLEDHLCTLAIDVDHLVLVANPYPATKPMARGTNTKYTHCNLKTIISVRLVTFLKA